MITPMYTPTHGKYRASCRRDAVPFFVMVNVELVVKTIGVDYFSMELIRESRALYRNTLSRRALETFLGTAGVVLIGLCISSIHLNLASSDNQSRFIGRLLWISFTTEHY